MRSVLETIKEHLEFLIEKNAIEYVKEIQGTDYSRYVDLFSNGKKFRIEAIYEEQVERKGIFKKKIHRIWYFNNKTNLYIFDKENNPHLYATSERINKTITYSWENEELEEKMEEYLKDIKIQLDDEMKELEFNEQKENVQEMINYYKSST